MVELPSGKGWYEVDAGAPTLLHEDRLFPADHETRALARRLYDGVSGLPILSPHGHTDPRWYACNEAFPNPAELFVRPDHYVFRMLYSQGVRLEELGIPRSEEHTSELQSLMRISYAVFF